MYTILFVCFLKWNTIKRSITLYGNLFEWNDKLIFLPFLSLATFLHLLNNAEINLMISASLKDYSLF